MKKILILFLTFSIMTLNNLLAYDMTSIVYSGISQTFDSNLFNSNGFDLNNDGTKMIGYSSFTNTVNQFTLTTPYDITTATYDNVFINDPSGYKLTNVRFSNDGTKLFTIFLGIIRMHNLSIAFDITSITFDVFNYEPVSSPSDIRFTDDGLKFFYIGYSPNELVSYDLSTAFDISTKSNKQVYNFPEFTSSIVTDFFFNNDGSKVFVFNFNQNKMYQYSLNSPYDVTSLASDNFDFFFGNEFNTPSNVFVTPDGSKLLFNGATSGVDPTIYVYDNVIEPPTYDVELTSNLSPYTNFIYTDDEENILTTSIDTTILNNESWSITSNVINTGPFTFNNWYDLDNNEIFTTNRTFKIEDPNRNYNLVADYTLDQSVILNLNSNLPNSAPIQYKSETIESTSLSAIINQNEFINYNHPYNFNYEINAPITNIGFYEFDYWYDNENDEIYSFNSTITGNGINNRDLTATYSLPEEYQINLNISTNIGFVTFQLGNQDSITGSTINVTVSSGDDWVASVPLQTNNFIFDNWVNIDDLSYFSNNNILNVQNTNNDYYLMAIYNDLYTVTWDSNGGTPIPSQKIEIGEFVNEPNQPTKPNFAFGGWYEEGDVNQTEINFPYQVTENITFTAIWLDTYTLTFDTNGGQKIDSITYIASETPEVVTPSRFGYEFEGWFTDDGTFQNAYDFNDPINQDTTIHAKWAFGSDRDAQLSLTTFLDDNDLGDGFSQIVIMITIYIFVNIIILIYQAPLIVTLILNFIVTSLFMILGWIAIWIVVVIFMALFGMLYFFSSGRGITE